MRIFLIFLSWVGDVVMARRESIGSVQEDEGEGLRLDSLLLGLSTLALALMEEAGKGKGNGKGLEKDIRDLLKQVKEAEVVAHGKPVVKAIRSVHGLVEKVEKEQEGYEGVEGRHGRVCRELAEEARRIEKAVERAMGEKR